MHPHRALRAAGRMAAHYLGLGGLGGLGRAVVLLLAFLPGLEPWALAADQVRGRMVSATAA